MYCSNLMCSVAWLGLDEMIRAFSQDYYDIMHIHVNIIQAVCKRWRCKFFLNHPHLESCLFFTVRSQTMWVDAYVKFLRRNRFKISAKRFCGHIYPIIKASPFSTRNVPKRYVGIKKSVARELPHYFFRQFFEAEFENLWKLTKTWGFYWGLWSPNK